MKDLSKALMILAFFGLIGAATTKPLYFPCDTQIYNYLYEDSLIRAYYQGYSHDTIVIWTVKDSAWDIKSSRICAILRDSCKLTGRKVLVVDSTSNPALKDTQWGKKIYFRSCP